MTGPGPGVSFVLRERTLSRQCDRNLVQAHRVFEDQLVESRFADLGIEISPRDQQSPETLRAFQKAEMERWWPIIKASNLRAE